MCKFHRGHYQPCMTPTSTSKSSQLHPPRLPDLPTEILSMITIDLQYHDLLHLASTCRPLRTFLTGSFALKQALRTLEDYSHMSSHFFQRRPHVLPCHICSRIYCTRLHFAVSQTINDYRLCGRMAYDRHCMKCITSGRPAFSIPGRGELFYYDKQLWVDCKVCRLTTRYDEKVLAMRLAWRNGMCWKCHEEVQEMEWAISSPGITSPRERRKRYGDCVRSYKEVRNKDFVKGVVLSRLSFSNDLRERMEATKGVEDVNESRVEQPDEQKIPAVPKQAEGSKQDTRNTGKRKTDDEPRSQHIEILRKPRNQSNHRNQPTHRTLRSEDQKVADTTEWLTRRKQLEYMANWSRKGG